jgi:hypothetical protein
VFELLRISSFTKYSFSERGVYPRVFIILFFEKSSSFKGLYERAASTSIDFNLGNTLSFIKDL